MRNGCWTGALLERDGELGVVANALREASEAGSVIVVAGPLGNGKTALVRELRRSADNAGSVVLPAFASPVDRDVAGGVARQLLESPVERPVLSEVVRDLGRDKPVLVLVDDLHWVDDESLSALEGLARRIQHLPAVLVVTLREGDPLSRRAAAMSIVGSATHRLRPAPLTPAGSAALVGERLGRTCDEEFGHACHEATGGNPLRLTALALAWAIGGKPATAANADAVRVLRPTQSRDRLVACMRAQPEPAKALLKAMAVLAESGHLDFTGALADLDEPDIAESRRALRELGLLVGDRFAYPDVRDAVEELMTTGEREELCVRAVRVLYDSGCPAEQVAELLLGITAPQGEWAVQLLRVAAEITARRGRPEAAARYLRRALLHASIDGQDRAMVLVDLAGVECGFDTQSAVRSTSYAVALLGTPRERAAAVIHLTPSVLGDAPPPVRSLLARIGGELGDVGCLDGVDRELALRIEARLRYSGALNSAELDSAVARLVALGPEPPMASGGDRELLAVLLHAAMVSAGRPAFEVAGVAGRLFEHEPALSAHASGTAPLLCTALAAADLPGVVTTWLDRAFGAARRRGDTVEQAMIRSEQSVAHLLSGQVGAATEAVTDAVDLGVWTQHTAGTSAALLTGAVAVQLRDPVLTDQMLAAVDRHSAGGCLDAVIGLLRGSAAVLRGDLSTASVTFAESGLALDRLGWRNPVFFPWRTALALVKHRLGETGEAVELAEQERLIAEEWGAPSGIGRALRVLGALTGGTSGVDLTGRAVAVLDGSAHRLELARALRQWAEMSARDDVWRRCLEVSTEIDAKSIAERARTALGHASLPVRTVRLTPSERRVALLAIRGRSNQEIAEALGIAARTVEKHLTNTYLKVGVRRRVELVEEMLSTTVEPADDGCTTHYLE